MTNRVPGTSPLVAASRLDQLLKDLEVPQALREAAEEWNNAVSSYSGPMKEEANRSQFLDFFHQGLGFTHGAKAKGGVYTLKEKQKTAVGQQFPDATFGLYGGPDAWDATIAVLELKDGGTDLSAKQGTGYAKTPTEQAFGYALKFADAQFVLVSNFQEIRLYSREGGELRSWLFRFASLGQHQGRERALKELCFFLSPERLLPAGPGGVPPLLRHLREAPAEQEKITRAFYQEYRGLRDEARTHYLRLLQDAKDPAAAENALEAAQKLLNRTLFAGFAQSRQLLPDGLLGVVTGEISPLEEKPIYRNLRMLFKHLDKGRAGGFSTKLGGAFKIPGFNGGLFRPDPIVDNPAFALTEDFARQLLHLANKDFVTELSVSVLGHCFESSLADLDAERGGGGRHDQGIYYTPDWVTRYICLKVLAPLVQRARDHAEAATRKKLGPPPEKPHDLHRWHLARFHRLHGELMDLKIVDPACGSGAFLAQGLRVLRELMEPDLREALAHATALPDVHDDAVHEDLPGLQVQDATEQQEALAKLRALPSLERCFHGVDLHEEAVLLTQLSLWLESAEKDRKLSDLSDRVKVSNSLTSDWEQLFPGTRFDAVIGNPPYVRMELFKDQKPHLRERFAAVHEERADLYCYFFQLSAELLKEGGRYGIIVSNKWLKAKYGGPSRAYLKSALQIEQLLDFGELPVFEDATTYPMIIVAERREGGTLKAPHFAAIAKLPHSDHELEDQALALGHAVPAAQLGADAWLLVDEAKGAVFATRAAKGIPLKEYLGDASICWGIKTGHNAAFWLDQETRDRILDTNPEAKVLLKPLVIGDEVRRWALRQDEPRFLIYTPKGRYSEKEFKDRFPEVVKHLKGFRSYADAKGKTVGLDHRATQQAWFELQQGQEAYEEFMLGRSIVWPDMSQQARFASSTGRFPANTVYFIPEKHRALVGVLNSSHCSDHIAGIASSIQGATLRFQSQYLESLTIPASEKGMEFIALVVDKLTHSTSDFESHRHAFTALLRQDAPWRCAPLGEKLERFWEQNEATVLAEALKRRDKSQKHDPTLAEREQLKKLWRQAAEPLRELAHQIQQLEAELDQAVEAAWEA
ncbi:MAG TPA: N-6 DNA methylase [Holophagaceae bacterium]|nr:N-6 DNA methylase [Holophagaceae bacterium]